MRRAHKGMLTLQSRQVLWGILGGARIVVGWHPANDSQRFLDQDGTREHLPGRGAASRGGADGHFRALCSRRYRKGAPAPRVEALAEQERRREGGRTGSPDEKRA